MIVSPYPVAASMMCAPVVAGATMPRPELPELYAPGWMPAAAGASVNTCPVATAVEVNAES